MHEPTPSESVVQASNVQKRFGSQEALAGIDLSVGRGEIVLVMGPNGAGKSVLMSCLSGSAEPSSGQIRLFGDRSPKDARPGVSTMFQGAMVDPDLTGRENLRFYEALHPNGTDSWRDLAPRLEIEADLDRVVKTYSGGMRRKIEIAITLTLDVPFYILDEPTIELDLATIRELHDMLLGMQDEGKTILVTSHAPLDAQIADRIAFLRDGRIIADDAPTEMLDELPDVLRVRGTTLSDEYVLGGKLFQRGDEIRGFLRDETDVADIDADVGGGDLLVDIDRPSYTDLFNYYTYIYERQVEPATTPIKHG